MFVLAIEKGIPCIMGINIWPMERVIQHCKFNMLAFCSGQSQGLEIIQICILSLPGCFLKPPGQVNKHSNSFLSLTSPPNYFLNAAVRTAWGNRSIWFGESDTS